MEPVMTEEHVDTDAFDLDLRIEISTPHEADGVMPPKTPGDTCFATCPMTCEGC